MPDLLSGPGIGEIAWPVLASIAAVVLILGLSAVRRARRSRGFDGDFESGDLPLVIPTPPGIGTPPLRDPAGAAVENADDPELFEGRTIRFYRPTAATLQLVPGRLEVVAGEDTREEIRFVRVPGETPEVTFGRSEGVPLHHIQLRAPTVSRQHARMTYADSRWTIVNFSRINPVVVNGVELVPPIDRRVLMDGDQIEMGEVVLRFHVR